MFFRVKDARKFLEKHNKRVDIAIDAYYNDPSAMAATARNQNANTPSTSKLNTLFDNYKGWLYENTQPDL